MRAPFVLLVAMIAFVSSANAQATSSETSPALGRILADALDRLKDWYDKSERLICPRAADAVECRQYSDLAATHAMFVYTERLEANLKGQQWSCDKSLRCPAAKAFTEAWLAKFERPIAAKEFERARKEPGYKSPLMQQGSVSCDEAGELLKLFKDFPACGWLGVKVQAIDNDMTTRLGLPQPTGVLISEVTPNGPAAGAGLRKGDIILAVNDGKIADGSDLAAKIYNFGPNKTVEMAILRNKKREMIRVKLGLTPNVRKN